MADLIDRKAAIDMFQRMAYDDWNQGTGTTWANAFSEAADMIEDLPSADAVEVVRCRDCEHYFTSNLEMAKNHGAECTMMRRRTMPEDYCSYGQKM